MTEFNTDPNAEAQILKDVAASGDHKAFQDQARQLLNHPDEFKAVQALIQAQAGQPGSLPGLELVSAQPGDKGSGAQATPDYIRLAQDTSLQIIDAKHTTDVCVPPAPVAKK